MGVGNVHIILRPVRPHKMGGRLFSDEEVPENWFSEGHYLEKRRAFLRSYKFHRKRELPGRLKLLLFGLGGAVSLKANSLRRLPRLVLGRFSWPLHRRRKFDRLRGRPEPSGCVGFLRILRL